MASINDLYAQSQLELAEAREQLKAEQVAHLNSVVLIARIAKGEIQSNQITITEMPDGRINWAFDMKDAPKVEA